MPTPLSKTALSTKVSDVATRTGMQSLKD